MQLSFACAGQRRELNKLKLGCTLQRLFSAFPAGFLGTGLLLLRLSLGIVLLYLASINFPKDAFTAVCGLFVVAGFWTPLAGGLTALDQAWLALPAESLGLPETGLHIFLAVLALSLAMLGPGALSVDARLFGRRRLDLDRKRPPKELADSPPNQVLKSDRFRHVFSAGKLQNRYQRKKSDSDSGTGDKFGKENGNG